MDKTARAGEDKAAGMLSWCVDGRQMARLGDRKAEDGGGGLFCNHTKILQRHTGREDAAEFTSGIKIWKHVRKGRGRW